MITYTALTIIDPFRIYMNTYMKKYIIYHKMYVKYYCSYILYQVGKSIFFKFVKTHETM